MNSRLTPPPRRFHTRRLLAAALAAPLLAPLLAPGPAHAEVTATGSVSPNPLFVTAQDDLSVGQSGLGSGGSGTLLINNGSWLATSNAYISRTGSAVTLTGAGSQWLVFGTLNVGLNGSTTLDVLDGGLLTSQYTRVVGSGSNESTITVNGVGAVWNNLGDLELGGNNANNLGDGHLVVSNGGVVNNSGAVFLGGLAPHTGTITLDGGTLNTDWGRVPAYALRGTGTINADHWLLVGDHTLSSAADLPDVLTLDGLPGQDITVNLDWSKPLSQLNIFGIDSGTLTLNNGLAVTSDLGQVQFSAGMPDALMTIDGPGTRWTVNETLDIGLRGNGALHITGGGSLVLGEAGPVSYDRALTLGERAGGYGELVVTGAGSLLDANATLEIGDEGHGRLEVTQGGRVEASGITLIGGRLNVAGAGSTLSLANRLYVGPSDGLETEPAVRIEDGAVAVAELLTIEGTQSTPAVVEITGQGTAFDVTNRLVVGNHNLRGALRVADGATLTTHSASIGLNANNVPASDVTVTGAGSQWTIVQDLYLGHDGTGTLTVADGGHAEVGGLLHLNRSNNTAYGIPHPIILDQGTLTVSHTTILFAEDIAGVGTVNANTWLLEGTHTVTGFDDLPSQINVAQLPGQNLTVNLAWEPAPTVHYQLFGVNDGDTTLTDGFALRSSTGYIGYDPGTAAEMTLTGDGTYWRADGLVVGLDGTGTLRVENGADLDSQHATLGQNAGASGTVIIAGADSSWSPTTDIRPTTIIGDYGNGLLRLEAGATFGPSTTYLGRNAGANGELVITGPGSALTSTRTLFFGKDGTDASGQLRVLDGGHAAYSSINVNSTGTQDSVIEIDGPGSAVVLTNGVYSDKDIQHPWLRITNGGVLTSAETSRVYGQIVIDGPGSAWDADGVIYLGDQAPGALDLTLGATLTTGAAFIGQNRLGQSNAQADVLIDGAGTHWTVDGDLTLGGTVNPSNPYNPGEYRGTIRIANDAAVTVNGALLIDTGVSGSFVEFDSGTLNVQGALALDDALTGTGTINADYWLIRGDHTITDFSTLPSQFVYDQLPGQDITVNVAWSDPSQPFGFFGVDFGTVSIGGGLSIQSTDGYLGFNPGTLADLTLTGAGTSWDVTDTLEVGGRGDATLRVHDGAQLSAEWIEAGAGVGRTGLLEVSGGASSATFQTLLVGGEGDGAVHITSGGGVSVMPDTSGNGGVVLGQQAGSSGELHLSGVGSVFASDTRVEVGVHGTGSVVVENGAAFDSGYDFFLGYYYDGVGELVVDDATWTGDGVYVGYDGTGSVELRNGATATAGFARLGAEPKTTVNGVTHHSNGTARVEGAGTTWDLEHDLTVAQRGKGQLDIVDGGVVNSRRGFVGSQYNADGNATVSGAGSAWHVAEDLNLYSRIDGGLRIEAGALVETQTANTSGGLTVVGPGSIFRSQGQATLAGGVIDMYEGARVEFLDDLTTTGSASLVFELGASGPGLIQVGGNVSVGNSMRMEVTLRDEVGINLGDQFTLIDIAGTRTGTSYYAIENQLLAQRDGVDLLLTYAAGDGNDIGLATALSGDLNADGLADGEDLHLILTHWGTFVTPGERTQGDLQADGYIYGADLLLAPQSHLALGEEILVQAIDGPDPFAYEHIVEGQLLDTHGGVRLLLTYLAGDGNDVAIFAALTGDADGDNVVGHSDLDIILANWDTDCAPYDRASGDLNGDGRVNGIDLALVRDHWGNNASSVGNVPEPTSALLLGIGALLIGRRRRPTG